MWLHDCASGVAAQAVSAADLSATGKEQRDVQVVQGGGVQRQVGTCRLTVHIQIQIQIRTGDRLLPARRPPHPRRRGLARLDHELIVLGAVQHAREFGEQHRTGGALGPASRLRAAGRPGWGQRPGRRGKKPAAAGAARPCRAFHVAYITRVCQFMYELPLDVSTEWMHSGGAGAAGVAAGGSYTGP